MAAALRKEFVQANGLRFSVTKCGEGKRLALLLHGFPECAYSWREQMPLLAELGYNVWAPDLRGYGETDKPPNVTDYAIENLLGDVAALIDASGCESTLLIAHDWGAVIAWAFAIERVRPLDRLVIMNVPHPAVFQREIRRWRQLRRSWYVFFFQIPRLPEFLIRARNFRAIEEAFRGMAIDKSRFPDEVIDTYKRNAAQPGALTAMINYYRAAIRAGRRNIRREYPPIETPTLMLWGEEDTALCKETTFGTDRHVSNLTLRYLPKVSHWVQQEAPEKVNAMLRAWLTGQQVPEAHQL